MFSWTDIYVGASFPLYPQTTVGGGGFPSGGEGGSDGIGLGLVAGRVRWRWDRIGLNGSALHVGDQLVGDLSQYVFSQPRHAQHMVTCAVHVVSEWHKLLWHRTEVIFYTFFKSYDWFLLVDIGLNNFLSTDDTV